MPRTPCPTGADRCTLALIFNIVTAMSYANAARKLLDAPTDHEQKDGWPAPDWPHDKHPAGIVQAIPAGAKRARDQRGWLRAGLADPEIGWGCR
jgi:hypothetical protein